MNPIKKHITFLFLVVSIVACKNDIKFEIPINTIEQTKNTAIVLTMENYVSKNEEIIASFIYKGKKARIKLSYNNATRNIEFIRIDNQSDYFVFALSEILGEIDINPKMKEKIECSIAAKGDEPSINFNNKDKDYKLFYKPNKDEKGSVAIRMKVNMNIGQIKMWAHNGKISNRNFVKAFEKM